MNHLKSLAVTAACAGLFSFAAANVSPAQVSIGVNIGRRLSAPTDILSTRPMTARPTGTMGQTGLQMASSSAPVRGSMAHADSMGTSTAATIRTTAIMAHFPSAAAPRLRASTAMRPTMAEDMSATRLTMPAASAHPASPGTAELAEVAEAEEDRAEEAEATTKARQAITTNATAPALAFLLR